MSGSVAVVIVNYRTPDLALEAARSVAGERGALPGLRVIIVDGGSGDGSAEQLIAGVADSALSSWVRVLPLALNGGFGWANNQAMLGLIQGDDPPDYIHLLNPDAVVLPGAIAALAAMLDQDPQCAAAGSALFNTDGSAAGSQFRFMSPPREFARGLRTDAIRRALGIKPLMIEGSGEVDDVDWVTGASLMLRVTALREVGLFDTGFFLYFEEVELCWRLKQSGWQVRHAPLSRVRHVGGAATGVDVRHADNRLAPPLPAYWFASRRRLLARTRGRAGTIAASLFWFAGHLVYRARCATGLGGRQRLNRHEARDLWQYGIVPSARDLAPQVTHWREPLGEPPAWTAP
jgi:N-acetylglucosaminyl-diphospho-decaprenol L-rhamnosyltransferase